MPRKTQKEILASPEWEWWQESINCIPDWDKRVYAKKRILGSLVSCNDSGGFWREQAEIWRDRWLSKKEDV